MTSTLLACCPTRHAKRTSNEELTDIYEQAHLGAEVKLLLVVGKQVDCPIYIVLTMRLDFLGVGFWATNERKL